MPVAAAAVLVVLGLLHFYWAAGGRWGHRNALPEVEGKPLFRPSKAATIAVGALLWLAAGIVALAWRDHSPLLLIGARLVAVAFAARALGDFRYFGFFKTVRSTAFAHWDTRLYAPLCLAMAAMSGTI